MIPNVLPAAAAAASLPISTPIIIPTIPNITPKVIQKPPNPTPTPIPIPIPIPIPMIIKENIKEEKIIEKEILDDGCVDIIFPLFYNPDLDPNTTNTKNSDSNLKIGDSHNTDLEKKNSDEFSLCVRLPKDISIEDLIFELRHYIATEVRT